MSQRVDDLPHIPLTTKPTGFNISNTYVEYVRLTWVDYANNPRCRILPRKYYSKLITNSTPRPGVRIAKVALGYVGARVAEGFTPVGNWLFVIDESSMRPFPPDVNVVTVFGWFQEINPSPNQRVGSLLDPRYVLHRTLQCVHD